MKYFNNVSTLEELRRQYKELLEMKLLYAVNGYGYQAIHTATRKN